MKNINSVFLIGRQTKDLTDREFRYLDNGNAVLNISLAVNSSKKNGDTWVDEVSYFDVTVWGKTAENLSRFINKGKLLAVRGHLQQQRWQADDGSARSKIAIIADEVELLSSSNQQQQGQQAPQYQQQGGVYQQAPQYQQYAQQQSAYAQQYQQQAPQQQPQQIPQQVAAVQQTFGGQVIDDNEIPWG